MMLLRSQRLRKQLINMNTHHMRGRLQELDDDQNGIVQLFEGRYHRGFKLDLSLIHDTPIGARCRSLLQETKILKDTDERDSYHPLLTLLEEQSDATSSVNKLLSAARVVENGVLTVEHVEQEQSEGLVTRLFRRLAGRDSPMEK